MQQNVAFDNVIVEKQAPSPSLRNLLKEISDDIGKTEAYNNPVTYLEHLPPQGVLLLNAALMVDAGEPASQMELWKPYTERLVKDLMEYDNIVWLLLGNFAKEFKSQITNETHKVVEAAHPSPMVKTGFFGSKVFSKVNSHLNSPITW